MVLILFNQMKRQGNLFEMIVEPENIRIAFLKAVKGKSGKRNVQNFREHLDEKVVKIRKELTEGNYLFGNYHFFTIYDPKKRLICAAPFEERVVFHMIMNVCHANFECYQIYDSYASRVGKGVYKALERAQTFCQKYRWFLKIDVKKYFDSISHEILKRLLRKRFKDIKLLNLFDRIIDSYNCEDGKGIPIGNLTSQYFANHYLAVADHYAKEVLMIKAYVRYMDDIVIFGKDKRVLLKIGHLFKIFCKDKLQLNFKIFTLNASRYGLPFLGYVVYGNCLRLTLRSKRRFASKALKCDRAYQKYLWTEEECKNRMNALLAFVKKANSYGFRNSVLYRDIFK